MGDPTALVQQALLRHGIAHEVIPCDPAAADTAVFCARYGIAPEDSANTILVASKKEPRRYAACVALATTLLDVNHKVRELLGEKRLSFANAEETVTRDLDRPRARIDRERRVEVGERFGAVPELRVEAAATSEHLDREREQHVGHEHGRRLRWEECERLVEERDRRA